MDERKKAIRAAALGGAPLKVVTRLDPFQAWRAGLIRDKFGFKSIYEINQYLWGCFLRVADPEHEENPTPIPDEIAEMFNDFAQAERRFEYIKPKRKPDQKEIDKQVGQYRLKGF